MIPNTNLFSLKRLIRIFSSILIYATAFILKGNAQPIDNNGCVGGTFGIDAGLYSGTIEYGDGTSLVASKDWFLGLSGTNVIDQKNPADIKNLLQSQPNPTYERRMSTPLSSIINGQIMIDGLFTRDQFGGTGQIDQTSYKTASKNGEDPAVWAPGPKNVLGKSDIIDGGGYMFRDGITFNAGDLWFVGLIQRADPGGDSYVDFEFFAQELNYSEANGFSSGGPDLGHTAFKFNASGDFTQIGDFIFNVMLSNGGATANVDIRLWVSRADFVANKHPAGFTWGTEFDGAFTGSPYGYALIVPAAPPEACGIINLQGQNPEAPPWGTLNTKNNTWGTTYGEYSVAELGMNLTHFGIDNALLDGGDPCKFPMHSFLMKSRVSNSFSSQLKDFSGPYEWGQPVNSTRIVGDPLLSCLNEDATLSPDPLRADANYSWTTIDGQINGNPNQPTITVTKPGTYTLHTFLTSTGCDVPDADQVVGYDPLKPFFNTPTYTSTVSCNGNNGTIDLTVTGGTPPYTYSWTKDGSPYVPETQDLSGLSPGTYVALITDFCACTIFSPPIIVPARNPVTIVPAITNVNCFGAKTGAVNLSVSGGKSPLNYLWSTGNTSEDLLNIGAGNYTFTITDADGCVTTAPYGITQPSALTATIVKTDDTNPDPSTGTGTADLTPSGGTPGYTYSWIGPNGFTSTSQNLTSLKYGQYTATVTDANGCTTTASVFIYAPEICNDGIDNDGNGLTDCDDTAGCKPTLPGNITASDDTPCTGQSITYTVPLNATYTSYEWTVPAGATISSGQGTNSINVVWNTTTGGQVCMNGKRFQCLSNPICLTVTPHDKPLQPGEIILAIN